MPARPVPDMEKKIEAALVLIAEGNSVRKSCAWAGIEAPTFLKHVDGEQYARARDACADAQFDEMADLEKRCLGVELKEGDEPLDPNRLRAVIDSRKWRLARMRPKMYGDKVGVELTGKDGGPVQHLDVRQMTDEQLHAILAQGITE